MTPSTHTTSLTSRRLVPLWLLICLLVAFVLGPREFSAGDTERYTAMVAGETVVAPFAYRVLVPALVRLLPVEVDTGFLLVTVVFSYLTLLVFYRLLEKVGAGGPAALLATAALALSYPIAYNLGHWGLIDPAAAFFFVLALYFLFDQRPGWMAVALFVGVAAKEAVLLLLPMLVWAAWRRPASSTAVRLGYVLLTAAPPLLLLVFLRLRILTEPSVYDVGSLDDLRALWAFIAGYNFEGYGFIPRLGREFLRSYGFFWTFALLGWPFVPSRHVRLVCLYLVAASVGLCLIATDWSRMLIVGFPGIFIPTAFLLRQGLQALSARWFVPLFLLLTAGQCYVALLSYEELGRTGQIGLIAGSVLFFFAGSALALYVFRKSGGRARSFPAALGATASQPAAAP